MINKKLGRQSVLFPSGAWIHGRGAVGGKKEGEGPLASCFDLILTDDLYGEKTWEKAESKMLKEAMQRAVQRAGVRPEQIDVMLSGDLLNQLMASSFMARDLQVPFLGLYGACSAMTESLVLASMLADGGFARNVLAGASSHFCTAERQFRMPVEHGNQRPPSAQWTATAAGAVVVSSGPPAEGLCRIRITAATVGKVIDAGMKDVHQMGAAMAPAAVDTLLNHLEDTGRNIDYYDLIATGDLGFIGRDIMADLLIDAGISASLVRERCDDCGTMLYSREQDVHSGGSGCGCSASVFAGHLLQQMEQGKLKKILLLSTGAMLSTISSFQGESIPGIAHAAALEVEECH